MPSGSIEARHLWKRFRGDRRRRFLRHELQRLQGRLRGDSSTGWRWALRDIDLSIGPGESVGLIGSNGSGKSTLLKILNGVMFPYAGSVDVRGRVGALIEVRAGIHPELSGRENIHLYGTFLGLSRREVGRRFDEIVEFAEVEDAIDRQVKFYSTGMQMRLGFAVAAFLEPDILLVDEVLAVGDASFQQRCLGRMREVLDKGTTLVFVSHDLGAVDAMCNRAIWLEQGAILHDGPAPETLDAYRADIEHTAEERAHVEGRVRLTKVEVGGPRDAAPETHSTLKISLVIDNPAVAIAGELCVGVTEGTAMPIFTLRRALNMREGNTEVACSIEHLPLPRGVYYIWVGVFDKRDNQSLLPWQPAARIEVSGPELDSPPRGIIRLAPVQVRASWETE